MMFTGLNHSSVFTDLHLIFGWDNLLSLYGEKWMKIDVCCCQREIASTNTKHTFERMRLSPSLCLSSFWVEYFHLQEAILYFYHVCRKKKATVCYKQKPGQVLCVYLYGGWGMHIYPVLQKKCRIFEVLNFWVLVQLIDYTGASVMSEWYFWLA